MAKKISAPNKPRKRSSILVQKSIKSYFSTSDPLTRPSNHKPNRREVTRPSKTVNQPTTIIETDEGLLSEEDVFGAGSASGSRALARMPKNGGGGEVDIDRGKF